MPHQHENQSQNQCKEPRHKQRIANPPPAIVAGQHDGKTHQAHAHAYRHTSNNSSRSKDCCIPIRTQPFGTALTTAYIELHAARDYRCTEGGESAYAPEFSVIQTSQMDSI
jgi:hypothetical protein